MNIITNFGNKRFEGSADELKKRITELGQEVDEDICDRLTGKAAVYIKNILDAVG